jgi:sugar phosphate isomerase/epimerase
MRIGISTWNYREPNQSLCELVSEFAEMGYTAMSFSQNNLLELTEIEASELKQLLQKRDLAATVHGACNTTPEQIRSIADCLGSTLHTFTVDALMRSDSRGRFYDVQSMVPVMLEVGQNMGSVCFAVEDFPLDSQALSYYQNDLSPLIDHPNYGILVDVGHLNLRCNDRCSSFYGMDVLEYLSGVPLPIIEVHLHDNLGTRDNHGHFGFGNINFSEVVDALETIGFNGISTVEIAPSFHDKTPAESKPMAKQSLEIWRDLWGL